MGSRRQDNFSAFGRPCSTSRGEVSVRRLLISASLRMMLARVVTIYVATVGLAAGVLFLSLAYSFVDFVLAPPLVAVEESPIWDQAWPMLVLTGVAYSPFFFLPFLVTLPLAVPIALIWRTPKRTILFRPFHRTEQSRTLKRLIRKHIAGFGHTYTLADVDIKLRWYVRIPVLFGQLSLWIFRPRPIRSLAQIDRLTRALRRRRLRNVNWCLMTGKTFPVVCRDDYWQPCVSSLLPAMDLILIDLSEVREHVLWEIEECRNLGLLDRVVFLVDKGGHEAASNWMSQCRDDVLDGSTKQRLLVYGQRGRMSVRAIRSTVARVLLRQKDTTYRHPLFHAFVVLCSTALVTFAVLGSFLWWSLPILAPRWIIKHSPFLDPVVRAYVDTAYDFRDSEPNLMQLALYRITKEFGSVAYPVLVRHWREGGVEQPVAIALGELGDKRAVVPLTLAHQDSNLPYRRLSFSWERDAVIEALIKLEADVVKVKNLIVALNDKNEYTQEYAAKALGYCKDPLVLEPLLHAISDANATVEWAAKEASNRVIERIGAQAVEPLIQALTDGDVDTRRYAIEALGRFLDDPRVVEPLIHARGDEDSFVGWDARDALNKVIDRIEAQAVEPLIQALRDGNVDIRRYAAKALRRFSDDPRVLEPLIHATGDEDFVVEYEAERALKLVVYGMDVNAVEPFIKALGSDNPSVRGYAKRSLNLVVHRIGVDAVEPLIKALGSDNPAARGYAANALGDIGDPRAIEPLKCVLNDENIGVRRNAQHALNKLKVLGMNQTTPKDQ